MEWVIVTLTVIVAVVVIDKNVSRLSSTASQQPTHLNGTN